MQCNLDQWISMLSLAKKVLEEYKPLIVKKTGDIHAILVAKTTFEFLCDVKIVMGIICIMPMLKVVHEFITFVQSHDTFVCNFVRVVKACFVDLYTLYCDL